MQSSHNASVRPGHALASASGRHRGSWSKRQKPPKRSERSGLDLVHPPGPRSNCLSHRASVSLFVLANGDDKEGLPVGRLAPSPHYRRRFRPWPSMPNSRRTPQPYRQPESKSRRSRGVAERRERLGRHRVEQSAARRPIAITGRGRSGCLGPHCAGVLGRVQDPPGIALDRTGQTVATRSLAPRGPQPGRPPCRRPSLIPGLPRRTARPLVPDPPPTPGWPWPGASVLFPPGRWCAVQPRALLPAGNRPPPSTAALEHSARPPVLGPAPPRGSRIGVGHHHAGQPARKGVPNWRGSPLWSRDDHCVKWDQAQNGNLLARAEPHW
jgi:hypothetical protein